MRSNESISKREFNPSWKEETLRYYWFFSNGWVSKSWHPKEQDQLGLAQ